MRHHHLLDVAARLVREGGWAALSMQGLAAAAGVSRQLVYAHFDSVDTLYLAALTHVFVRSYAATERGVGPPLPTSYMEQPTPQGLWQRLQQAGLQRHRLSEPASRSVSATWLAPMLPTLAARSTRAAVYAMGIISAFWCFERLAVWLG